MRHSLMRTSSAGAYHHPGVSNFGASSYHSAGISRISLCWSDSSAFRRLLSDFRFRRVWHRDCLVMSSHPRTWALKRRSMVRSSCSSASRTSVTFPIHWFPNVCMLTQLALFARALLTCSGAWGITSWQFVHLVLPCSALHVTHDLLWHSGQTYVNGVKCFGHLSPRGSDPGSCRLT